MSDEVKDFGGGYILWIMVTIMGAGNLFSWWSIPWLWVFSPIWLPYALLFGILGMVLFFLACIMLVGGVALIIEMIRESL